MNGESKYWFKGERGARQGGPLSSFLFTLVVYALSRMLNRGNDRGVTRGHNRLRTLKSLICNLQMAPFISYLSIRRISRMSYSSYNYLR